MFEIKDDRQAGKILVIEMREYFNRLISPIIKEADNTNIYDLNDLYPGLGTQFYTKLITGLKMLLKVKENQKSDAEFIIKIKEISRGNKTNIYDDFYKEKLGEEHERMLYKSNALLKKWDDWWGQNAGKMNNSIKEKYKSPIIPQMSTPTNNYILDEDFKTRIENEKSFFIGCQKGDKGRVLYLLDKGANVNAIDAKTGKTGLHYAVEGLYTEIVKMLLNKGADPNLRDKEGLTPILLNAKENSKVYQGEIGEEHEKHHIEIIERLLKAGADINDRKVPEGLNVFGIYIRHSPLTDGWGGYQFDKNIASFLLKKGANINAKTLKDIYSGYPFIPEGSTILDIMTATYQNEKIDFLKQHGAEHGTWAKYYLKPKEIK
jgi:ankyrin repeat protein